MSSIVDHIIPIDVRPDWRLEIDNTQVLCNRCHAIKTATTYDRYGAYEVTREQIANRVQRRV